MQFVGVLTIIGVIVGLFASSTTIKRNCEPLSISECFSEWVGWAKQPRVPTADQSKKRADDEKSRLAALEAKRLADEAENARKSAEIAARKEAEERERAKNETERLAALEKARLAEVERRRIEREQQYKDEIQKIELQKRLDEARHAAEQRRRAEAEAADRRARCRIFENGQERCCGQGMRWYSSFTVMAGQPIRYTWSCGPAI